MIKTSSGPDRAGMTLIELIVVLAIAGILLSFVGIAFPSGPPAPPMPFGIGPAVHTGKIVSLADSTGLRVALPDGRGIGLGMDPMFPNSCAATETPSDSVPSQDHTCQPLAIDSGAGR